MMNSEQVVDILTQAFYSGSCGIDDRQQVINDLLKRYEIEDTGEEPEVEEQFRIYKFQELIEFPIGTKFIHESLGECMLSEKDGKKLMTFAEGFKAAGFYDDDYPWNKPMKRING